MRLPPVPPDAIRTVKRTVKFEVFTCFLNCSNTYHANILSKLACTNSNLPFIVNVCHELVVLTRHEPRFLQRPVKEYERLLHTYRTRALKKEVQRRVRRT